MSSPRAKPRASRRSAIALPSIGRICRLGTRGLLLAACATAASAGCTDNREGRARQSVRHLVEATPSTYDTALEHVVALGSYALPDIEQQLHGANVDKQIYLLEAVRQIGDRNAAPLLRFWARRAEDERVRKKAAAVLAEL